MRKKSDYTRISEFTRVITQVLHGDYSGQIQITSENDVLDSLAGLLNKLIGVIRNSADNKVQGKNSEKINAELLIAKEKAEENDRLKSVFLANISHEIRTQMNGILGFAALLKKPEVEGEKQRKYITIIEKSGERMLNIINDLIDISKIESGQMNISPVPTNINEQMEFIYAFFRPEVEKKGMRIEYEPPLHAEDMIIVTDREKLYAILINLVKNAIKYSDKGLIEFGYEIKAGFLEFFVKDSGIGIEKNRQRDIFDRFVQTNSSTKRTYEGAGLGLAISKAYTEMLGGKIRVISELGKGSQFYFTIPVITEGRYQNPPAAGVSDSVGSRDRRLKILIVEDDEVSDMLLTLILKDYAHTILHTVNGIEAVNACRNNKDIDLVLMDMKMPEMNGYEAVAQIREFNKTLVIIAQTAFALPSDKEKALKAGCDDYIEKPINREVLLATIDRHFNASSIADR
jgi:signal transduction histidine kinase/ActR/RegA family two-component response regulator